MKVIYKKPESLTNDTTIYCAGCGHGIIHRLIAQKIIFKEILAFLFFIFLRIPLKYL